MRTHWRCWWGARGEEESLGRDVSSQRGKTRALGLVGRRRRRKDKGVEGNPGGCASSGLPEDLLGLQSLREAGCRQQWGWCVEHCRELGGSEQEGSVLNRPLGALASASVPRLLASLNRRSLNSQSPSFLELQLLEAEQEIWLKGSGSTVPLSCPPADLVTWVCLCWELGCPCTGWTAASQTGRSSVAFRSWPCCPKLLWPKATA